MWHGLGSFRALGAQPTWDTPSGGGSNTWPQLGLLLPLGGRNFEKKKKKKDSSVALFGEGAAERGSEDHSARPPPHALVSAALSPLPPYLSSFLRHTPTVCTQHVALLNIYVYTHPYTYNVWSPLSFLFLKK